MRFVAYNLKKERKPEDDDELDCGIRRLWTVVAGGLRYEK